MKYDQAMAGPDSEQWKKAVQEEHERMDKHKVQREVPKDKVPKNAKVVISTWKMKKSSNGTYRLKLNDRGFEQRGQDH